MLFLKMLSWPEHELQGLNCWYFRNLIALGMLWLYEFKHSGCAATISGSPSSQRARSLSLSLSVSRL